MRRLMHAATAVPAVLAATALAGGIALSLSGTAQARGHGICAATSAGNPLYVVSVRGGVHCKGARAVLDALNADPEGLFGTTTKTVTVEGRDWRCTRHQKKHFDAQGNEAASLSGTCSRGHEKVSYNSVVYG